MRKYIFLSLLLIWSVELFAASSTSIRLHPDNELVVNATTNQTFPINSAKPSGDGSSESAPVRIYVPMEAPSGGNANYFIERGVTTLFSRLSTAPITIPLYLNATASDYYLYAAIKDTTNTYKLAVKHATGPFNGTTNSNTSFPFSISALCAQVTGCTDFDSNSNFAKSYLMYIYFSTTLPNSITLGATITPSGSEGMYVEVNMSNKVYASTEVLPVVTKVRPGDGRLVLEYTSQSISNPKSLRVFSHDGSAPAGGSPIRSYETGSGALLPTEYTYSNTGEVTVADLGNGGTYNLSILFVDLYKFGTVLSDAQVGQPMAIQELLKKEACFLLTAGFGEDHYVISYFRHFRDAVLLKSFLGRAFVNFYYETAPKYALLIYKHETLRAMIRGIGYSLYFIFNYLSPILLSSALAAGVFYLYKKRGKIKI